MSYYLLLQYQLQSGIMNLFRLYPFVIMTNLLSLLPHCILPDYQQQMDTIILANNSAYDRV